MFMIYVLILYFVKFKFLHSYVYYLLTASFLKWYKFNWFTYWLNWHTKLLLHTVVKWVHSIVLFSRCYSTFHVAMLLLFAILSGTPVTPSPAALPSSAVASPGEAEDPDIHHECDMWCSPLVWGPPLIWMETNSTVLVQDWGHQV